MEPVVKLPDRVRGADGPLGPFADRPLRTEVAMESTRPTRVDILGLTKRFRDVTAVDDVSLVIDAGTLLGIVGPTGSGKTTLLRLIAGLETPTAGEVRFNGEVVDRLPPNERRVRMVFQQDTLYPHLRVYKDRGLSNLGFPLNLRRVTGERLRTAVDGIASRVGITRRLYPRRPRQLSSGERQKVAFGRALALPPRVLLLDEPFSSLDSVSRHRAQEELQREHADHPVTTIHVTHSLSEAFALADRIVVMDEGQVIQHGTPDDIRRRPANRLVRELVESSRSV